MWREALTFVGQPTLLSGRPRDTQEIEDGQRTRWRDDLDSFGKTLTLCSVKRGPGEVNGEGLCPTG